jgi:hypothetical protein
MVWETGASFRGFEGLWSKDGKSVFYLYGDTELRARDVQSARETTLHRGAGLRHLARSNDGAMLAFGEGEGSILIMPVAGGEKRRIQFEVHELEQHPIAAARALNPRGWCAAARHTGNRERGFPLRDGKRLAQRLANEIGSLGL